MFSAALHRIARTEDHDLWMTFFNDPDGHILALMMEASKGWGAERRRLVITATR